MGEGVGWGFEKGGGGSSASTSEKWHKGEKGGKWEGQGRENLLKRDKRGNYGQKVNSIEQGQPKCQKTVLGRGNFTRDKAAYQDMK